MVAWNQDKDSRLGESTNMKAMAVSAELANWWSDKVDEGES